LDSAESTPYPLLQRKLASADQAQGLVCLIGDLVIAAFFSAEGNRQRCERRDILFAKLSAWFDSGMQLEHQKPLAEVVKALRFSEHPLEPFHWGIQFPEVFDRENSGFDAIVGNPPFAGKNTLIEAHPKGYLDWLKMIHAESHGNADLVAHFYRRAFNLLRNDGCFGLIATNTIRQGDTRFTGLRWICTHDGAIYAACKRVKWPGEAAVIVSVVHVCKGQLPGPYDLDGRPASIITAYLFHTGGHENPSTLHANEGKSFIGSYVLGMGFTFDDTDTTGVTTPIAEMHRLIEKNPRNAERISPYIGGEEILTSPTHSPHRYVINFGEMSEDEARQWPDLMTIVEAKVKPDRMKLGDNADARRRKEHWWLWGRYTPALFETLSHIPRVLALSRVGQQGAIVFLPSSLVFAESVVVFALPTFSAFSVLQSRVHELWARFFASSMKDDLRYTPTDCFETFPFPEGLEMNGVLEQAGREYYEFRAKLMVRNNEGLTKTYNRFHAPDERSLDILRLRELHDAMDRAVLDAYGWSDVKPTCEFLLDYEENDEENGARSSGRGRRKPWRYRWPDDVRDEVLARLLALNQERAAQERLLGQGTEVTAPNSAQRRTRGSSARRPSGGRS
ncbi:MAG TPA: type IIL restriction-modification enzyme MmeI, partial [Chthonomonadales bacterium]|nr:type IIL restriction-modification enzyme MmeI [Chthonomonadales bacterium]